MLLLVSKQQTPFRSWPTPWGRLSHVPSNERATGDPLRAVRAPAKVVTLTISVGGIAILRSRPMP
jgi:hypothetical protein